MALNLQLKRNEPQFTAKTEAVDALKAQLSGGTAVAGEPMLSIYKEGEDEVKILFGIADGNGGYTIFDSEAVPADVQTALDALKGGSDEEIDDAYDTIKEIGDALVKINGNGEGSINNAKDEAISSANEYTDTQIQTLDVADSAEAKKFVTSVSETDGKITVSRGAITSTGGTITLTDGADGGVNIEVVSSALTQYVGSNAITVSGDDGSEKTISLVLNAADKVLTQSVDGLMANINLTWSNTDGLKLIGKAGTEIATIPAADFIKDGMLENVELKVASVEQPVDTATTGTFLVFTFNTDGGSKVINLDVTSLIDVYTAGNGIDVAGKVISAKIDPSTEAFLTVGADGIKLSGVQAAIDAVKSTENAAIDKIEASVGLAEDGSHVTTSGQFTNSATTVVGEIAALDSALATVSGKVDAAQAEIDQIESAVGLNDNGQFVPNTGNTYTSGASSIVDAVNKLDAQVKANADAITASTFTIEAGNGITVSGDDTKTIAAKVGTNGNTANFLEVTADGIRVKDNAVLDMGTYGA